MISKIKNAVKIFCLFLCFFVLNVCFITSVQAGATLVESYGDVSTGGSGSKTCNSGNCFSPGAFGVRITLVNDETGKRWNNPDGTALQSIDVWFSYNSAHVKPETSDGYSGYRLTAKYTRQEILSNLNKDNKYPIEKFNAVVNESGYPLASYPLIGSKFPSMSEQNFGSNPASAGNVINFITTQANSGNYVPLQQLLDAFGLKHTDGTNVNFDSVTGMSKISADIDYLGDLALQFEPLVVIHNYGASSGFYTFTGTITEFAYFNLMHGYPSYCSPMNRYCCNQIGNVILTRQYNYEGIYSPNTHGKLSGTSALSTGTGRVCTVLEDYSTAIYGFLDADTPTAHGVGFITLSDIYKPVTCEDELKDILSKYPGSAIKSVAAVNALKSLYYKYPNNNLLVDWEKYGKSAPSCAHYEPTCDDELKDILKKHNNNYTSAMNDLKALYEKYKAKGNDYNVLIEWNLRGHDKPACKYAEVKCDPKGVASIDDCNTGMSYFRDDYRENIWLTCEMAYSKNGNIYSSNNTGHTAVETDNGGVVGNNEYCEVFCYEEVETYFPTSVSGVKAGQVFRWGSYDGTFGTVKVTKKCSTKKNGYKFDKWLEDYEANKANIVKFWNNKQIDKYTGALLTQEELLNKIEQCTNNLKYINNTDIRFTFTEPVNSVYGANTRSFSYDGNLDVTGSFNKDNVNTSKCEKKTVRVYEYDTESNKSISTTKEVWDCDKVTWDLSGTYTYKYPTNRFMWYTLKTNGELVNEEVKGSESGAFFYSVGFGLPTALSLPNGNYKLNVTVSNIGDSIVENSGTLSNEQQYNRLNGHFAYLANPVNTINGSGYGFDYSCVYEVENEIFGYDCQYDEEGNLLPESPAYCDEKEDDNPDGSLVGIDISYRLVTLLSDGDSINKAFPGKDGDGREPGGNWDISEESLYDILDANVYNTDQAMYEIMLDVNAIQKIRQDNETYFEAGKDPYTSYVDANNEKKVYCATGDGQQKYCASDFISELNLGSGLNYRLLGTCLPEENKGTLERAKYILENGCDAYYDYPTISWAR